MFLKYALFFARQGETGEAYDMISAAHDANVFHHSNESMFLIHMCWAGTIPDPVLFSFASDSNSLCPCGA